MENLNEVNIKYAIEMLRNHGVSNGGTLGFHAGWCDIAADQLEDAFALIKSQEERIEELAEENESLTLKVAAYQVKDKLLSNQLDDKCDMCIARERADTVRKMQDKLAQYIGTYTEKDKIPIIEMFRLLDKFEKEMFNDE